MWGNYGIEWRLFTYLKKDFYKYFLDDEWVTILTLLRIYFEYVNYYFKYIIFNKFKKWNI
jgi:hypothetical protein